MSAGPASGAAAGAGGAPLLRVRGLDVALPPGADREHAIRGLDLELSANEILCVVGESGSGKSMTASALMRLLPTGVKVVAGGIEFDGRDLLALDEAQMREVRGAQIAMVFQEPMTALDPSFTIGTQITEVIHAHSKVSRDEATQRAVAMLDRLGITNAASRLDSYPHQFSGGMRQRVMLALGMSNEPSLLIADEPTTALDVTVQAEILGVLRVLCENTGLAVMLVTHDWGVVADICQRVVVMYAGQVVESGPVAALVREPLNPYTEGLLQSSPADAAPRQPLVAIPGSVPRPHEWPSGCRFAPRCRYAIEACRASPVDLVEVATGRSTRCIRRGDLERLELVG